MFPLASRLDMLAESVINEMHVLAHRTGAINLASGYPDFDPPAELLEAATRALQSGFNQYAIPWGAENLRRALAEKQSRWMRLVIDPETHVTITAGGTEAMMAVILAVCNPGDKLVVFSPYYENYANDIRLAGAEPVFVPLRPPELAFDPDEMRAAFQAGAKGLVLCNPSNPSGKVFSPAELAVIASLAHEFDALVIADEVYEHIVYSPHRHTYIASLPGMFERTVSCGSLSKTYSITGWRIGYTIAPEHITLAIRKLHDYLTLGTAAPLQEAAVTALRFPDSYYHELQQGYSRRRDLFLEALDHAGLGYIPPQGAYFVLADISSLGFDDDTAFCRWLAPEIGLAGVPGSYFFHEPVKHLVRFNFAKREETLAEISQRLQLIAAKIPPPG
jgi:aminotransferase